MNSVRSRRTGLRDIWNAFMLEGARYTSNDIPFCPTTATKVPAGIITWVEARRICKDKYASGVKNFRSENFVCFYIDDHKFDGPSGIWWNPRNALKVLRHFAGVITPDFSTYNDFPEPIKRYNTFRMRAIGYWLGKNGIAVINNIRWGSAETYSYCFDGVSVNSLVAIGTVGGRPRELKDRARFNSGISEMMRVLSPHTIIVYGSANYPCFKTLTAQGVEVVAYSSQTANAFRWRHWQ